MPNAISNTSPLLYLHRIGVLRWLPSLFSAIWAPQYDSLTTSPSRRKSWQSAPIRGVVIPFPAFDVAADNERQAHSLILHIGRNEAHGRAYHPRKDRWNSPVGHPAGLADSPVGSAHRRPHRARRVPLRQRLDCDHRRDKLARGEDRVPAGAGRSSCCFLEAYLPPVRRKRP